MRLKKSPGFRSTDDREYRPRPVLLFQRAYYLILLYMISRRICLAILVGNLICATDFLTVARNICTTADQP